jgi:hypothetical protein
MTDLGGYDNSNFASFAEEQAPEVQQLPSLPVDEVLPKADETINKKQVSFEEDAQDESLQKIVPQEKKEKKNPKDNQFSLMNFVSENSIYMLALLLVIGVYFYNKYY